MNSNLRPGTKISGQLDSVTQCVWVYPEKFNIDFLPQIFFLTCIVTPKKILGQKPNVKFFRVTPYVDVTSKMGFLKRARK